MAYIRGDITLLREKEYNENREKFRGRRGIPKITTIGKRVYENLISHLWLMDSDHPDSVELMRMAR